MRAVSRFETEGLHRFTDPGRWTGSLLHIMSVGRACTRARATALQAGQLRHHGHPNSTSQRRTKQLQIPPYIGFARCRRVQVDKYQVSVPHTALN